jgi:hypothetical protein
MPKILSFSVCQSLGDCGRFESYFARQNMAVFVADIFMQQAKFDFRVVDIRKHVSR